MSCIPGTGAGLSIPGPTGTRSRPGGKQTSRKRTRTVAFRATHLTGCIGCSGPECECTVFSANIPDFDASPVISQDALQSSDRRPCGSLARLGRRED